MRQTLDSTRDPLRIRRSVVAGLVTLALLATLTAVPASAASANTCKVRNLDTGRIDGRLQKAANHARPGHRLVVRGTCRGTTVIRKNLSIKGRSTKLRGKPILDGTRSHFRVMTVLPGVKLTMRNLIVKNANNRPYSAGIANYGTLILHDVRVRNNRIGVRNRGGRLTLHGISRIHRNLVAGVRYGTVTLNDHSSIRDNRPWSGSDRCIRGMGAEADSVTLNDNSHISGNCYGVAVGRERRPGSLTLNGASSIRDNFHRGVLLTESSQTLTLNGSSSISGNGRSGIYVSYGTVTLNDSSSISGNKEDGRGGGADLHRGSLTLNGSSHISGNSADGGGGVFLYGGTLTLNDGSHISGNSASSAGGGVLVSRWAESPLSGVDCGPGAGANVRNNAPDDCYFEP